MQSPQVSLKMQGPKSARLEIYGEIGPSSLGMIDGKEVSAKLKSAGELASLEVRINSVGGSAFEGLAIHNILKEHPAKVDVVVDGIAATVRRWKKSTASSRKSPSTCGPAPTASKRNSPS